MFEYAHVVRDEHVKTTIEQTKVVTKDREKEYQSQGTILKAISKIVGQRRQEITSQPIRQLFDELGG